MQESMNLMIEVYGTKIVHHNAYNDSRKSLKNQISVHISGIHIKHMVFMQM